MAKKNPVDAALDIARNVIPKKPVKTKGQKTVPAKLEWGNGIPDDKLAYLNDEEMALVQAHRMFKGKRSVNGVPAFADDSSSSMGVERAPESAYSGYSGGGDYDRGTTYSGNTFGRGDSYGGSMGGGGPDSSSPSQSSGETVFTKTSGVSNFPKTSGQSDFPKTSGETDFAKTSGESTFAKNNLGMPSGLSGETTFYKNDPATSAPALTRGLSAADFSNVPSYSAPVTNATLDRIAQGSSVLGGAPAATNPQPSAPAQTPPTVHYEQTPTVTPFGPTVGTAEDPYNQRYAKAAGYLGLMTPTAPPAAAPAGNPTGLGAAPAYNGQYNPATNSYGIAPAASETIAPDYTVYSQNPSQEVVAPSQQETMRGYFTDAQRDAYLNGTVGGMHSGANPEVTIDDLAAEEIAKRLGRKRKTGINTTPPVYIPRSYMDNSYGGNLPPADPDILAFRAYQPPAPSAYYPPYKRGGKVGDSVDAAIRLARKKVVKP